MDRQSAPDLFYELRLGYPDLEICGVDEVGRGCLAGPVVAAAVVLPKEIFFSTHPHEESCSAPRMTGCIKFGIASNYRLDNVSVSIDAYVVGQKK